MKKNNTEKYYSQGTCYNCGADVDSLPNGRQLKCPNCKSENAKPILLIIGIIAVLLGLFLFL